MDIILQYRYICMIIYPSATCAGGGFSSHHLAQMRTSLAVVVVTPVLCTGVVFFFMPWQ